MDNSAIYINADAIRKHIADTSPSPQLTARNRSHRSVLVCLVVLCVLLLTAVIVLCVLIYTNNHQFIINNKNITQERDQLLTQKINLTEERDELRLNYNNISMQCEQLRQEKNKLWEFLQLDGWIYYESSLYFISSDLKNWTESRRYCRERGADLIIINNKEEQYFVGNTSDSSTQGIWIGLSKEAGTWKWADNSTMTSECWGTGEPNGGTNSNCVETYRSFWNDQDCSQYRKWICESKTLK